MLGSNKPLPSVKLTTLGAQRELLLTYPELFVMKHRSSNHPVAAGVYTDLAEAEADFKTIPSGRSWFTNGHNSPASYCQGCGVGCADEYEIVRITPKMKDWKMKKLIVKSA